MKKINKNTYQILKNKKKNFNKKKQKITIITVVYYGESTLEKTIKNVIKQKYSNLEYIVVYSPSKDKTFDIIKKYKKNIDKILINFDIGIYQSMNLGASFADGDYINYMNSGDYFFNTNVIKSIFEKKKNDDVIYGNCQVYYKKFKRDIFAKKIEHLKDGMIFSHQSCFVKSNIQKKFFFNKFYYYAADYDFFAKIYKKKYKFLKLNKNLSKCMSNGIVDKKKHITLYQNLLISIYHFKHANSLDQILKKIFIISIQCIKYFIKLLIPNNLIEHLIRWKYL